MCDARRVRLQERKNLMDKDVVKGKVKQVEGRADNVAGAVTNDLGQQIEGKVKEAAGKVQEEFGKAKDAIRDEQRRTERSEPA